MLLKSPDSCPITPISFHPYLYHALHPFLTVYISPFCIAFDVLVIAIAIVIDLALILIIAVNIVTSFILIVATTFHFLNGNSILTISTHLTNGFYSLERCSHLW